MRQQGMALKCWGVGKNDHMLLYTTAFPIVWEHCKTFKHLSDKYRLNLKEWLLEDKELGESCRTLQENHGKAQGTMLCDLCCWRHGMFCPLPAGLEHGKLLSQSPAQTLRADNRQHEKSGYNFIQHWMLNDRIKAFLQLLLAFPPEIHDFC